MASKKDFAKFYNDHIDRIYRFVFFRCRDRELAEDLVSEIFLKALDHFADFDETMGKAAWLMTIAKNHVANYWRDRKVTTPLTFVDESGEEEEAEFLGLKQALNAWQKTKDTSLVYELLAKIEPNEAEIVTLHYLIGYSYLEIAERRGASAGAIKVAAHRALKKLRKFL
ncbi:MAG: RNA polymerase sigma factor [Candidatus Magasanikbacteria bacterium]|nr:RNA polymerase sigma factor [Candidatus Magasanikbacteria bacterium]